eukprot:SAG11_NODE_3112_length_2678_cov_2.781698_3_plen_93_part_00
MLACQNTDAAQAVFVQHAGAMRCLFSCLFLQRSHRAVAPVDGVHQRSGGPAARIVEVPRPIRPHQRRAACVMHARQNVETYSASSSRGRQPV